MEDVRNLKQKIRMEQSLKPKKNFGSLRKDGGIMVRKITFATLN